MSEEKKDALVKYGIPFASVFLSLAITVVGAVTTSKIHAALMDERIAVLQRDQARHEAEKGESINRLFMRDEDKEQRIIRLETNFAAMQETLAEMKGDIKTLIRSIK